MSYRLKRMMTLIVMISMLGAVLAACGGGGGDGSGSTGSGAPAASGGGGASAAPAGSGAAAPGGGEAAACPPAAQGQQITMWSPLTGPDGNTMTQLAQRFSQENGSGIRVQHVAQPEYLQKLNTAAAGGGLPDMTVIRASDIAEMAARGVLKPMSAEALSAAGGDDLGSQFPDQVWNIGSYQDQRYAVPLDVHPLVLYYNKELLQAAGITVPTDRPMTREEFEAAVQALNKDGVAGIAVGTLFSTGTMFETLLRQFGGNLTNDDGTEATYNSEAGVQALTYIRDLKQANTPELAGAGDPEVTQFQQRRAAMVIHGPWHINNLSKLPFTGYAPIPQIGDEFAVWGGSHQLALTTEDPAKQAAGACWIGWLSQNSAQWATAGQVPIRNSVRESPDLATVAPPIAAFASEAEQVIMPPPIPGLGSALGTAFQPALDAVVTGEQTDIQKALDDAATKSNQLLQENAKNYGGGQ